MIGKLIIIGIIVAAGIYFVPMLMKAGPEAPPIEVIKQNVDHFTNKAQAQTNNALAQPNNVQASSLETQTQSNSTKLISLDQADPKYVERQNYTGQVFEKDGTTCKISIPDMAETINYQKELTHIIQVEHCQYKIGDIVQVTTLTAKGDIPEPVSSTSQIKITPYDIGSSGGGSLGTLGGTSSSSVTPSSSSVTPSSSSVTPSSSSVSTPSTLGSNAVTGNPTLPDYYKVIQLNAEHQGNDVVIYYNDSSGKTTSVTVTLQNSDKQIFSGNFISSRFQTTIKDVPNTPHMIEMTIQSSVYGTLHASVYAPANLQNSTISGIFTNS